MKILQQKTPLGDSILWDLSKKTYQDFGLSAWTKYGTPFFLSSNSLLAKTYASFAKEISQNLDVYDLGVGTGRFAYLFLLHFLPKRYKGFDICSQMIDNLTKHPYLKPFHIDGILEGHYFPKHRFIPEKEAEGDSLVIANYFFDTIRQDLFMVKDGSIYQGVVTLSDQSVRGEDDPLFLQNLKIDYDFIPYRKKGLPYEQILSDYATFFSEKSFYLPLGAFQVIDELSEKNVILLHADQGFATLEKMKNSSLPPFARHGTLSLAVNGDAIQRYVSLKRGNSYTPKRSSYDFFLMASSFGSLSITSKMKEILDAIDLPKLSKTVDQYLMEGVEISLVLDLLQEWDYDPCVFFSFYEKISKDLATLYSYEKERLEKILLEVKSRFYFVDEQDKDLLSALSSLLLRL